MNGMLWSLALCGAALGLATQIGCGSESVASPAIVAAAPAKPVPSAQPASQRPPADRVPTRPGDAEKISFDDLNLGMREDMVYRPFLLTERVKELDGKQVRIVGFMHAGATGKGIKEFVLLKNTECKYGPGGQADHLAGVYLAKGQTTKYQGEALKVEGTLKLEPQQGIDGNTWQIYRLEDAKLVR